MNRARPGGGRRDPSPSADLDAAAQAKDVPPSHRGRKVALYARVSSDTQAQRGTIASQLEALRAHVAGLGHEAVAVYTDDGYSGARLDRPGLDALRDAAVAGAFEAVWCLSPDRLARSFAYQVVVIDELARFGVEVRFTDSPPIDDDPQARLLVGVQGLFAEYERAKLAERVRRGKLYRVRSGEAVFPRVAYGYRRVPRSAAGPARLEVYEPEAVVVRRIFEEYASGTSMREIVRHLYESGVSSPDGKQMWPVATIGHLLRNTTYAGTAAWYRYEYVPAPELRRSRKVRKPRQDWVELAVPAIVTCEVFAAAQAVVPDNSRFSARNTTPDTFLLRGLVVCGPCGIRLFCDQKRSSKHPDDKTRYYGCPNHDPIKAGGPDRRCREPMIRADALDAFVFDQVKAALLRPELLLAGEAALAGRRALPADELLDAQLERIGRQIDATNAERRRLADLYQADLITLAELQRRAGEVASRRARLESEHTELRASHQELAGHNQLRRRIANFAAHVADGFEHLDFEQRQRLMRLVVEAVHVTGWKVEIRLRVPLDGESPDSGPPSASTPTSPYQTEIRELAPPRPAPEARRIPYGWPAASLARSDERRGACRQGSGRTGVASAVGQGAVTGCCDVAQGPAKLAIACILAHASANTPLRCSGATRTTRPPAWRRTRAGIMTSSRRRRLPCARPSGPVSRPHSAWRKVEQLRARKADHIQVWFTDS